MQRIREYLRAFWSDWVGLMSGATSVVLAVTDAIAATPFWVFWLASAFCFIGASFRIWLNERKKVEALQQQLGHSDMAVTIRKLTELADYGTVHLQNKPRQTESEVYDLWCQYGKWEFNLLQVMEQGGCKDLDIAQIRLLDTFSWRGFCGLNKYHTQLMEIIAERVARIREIVQRIEKI